MMMLDYDCDFLEDIPDCTFCTCVYFWEEDLFLEDCGADDDDGEGWTVFSPKLYKIFILYSYMHLAQTPGRAPASA